MMTQCSSFLITPTVIFMNSSPGLGESLTIKYLDYDWSLNGVGTRQ